MSVLAPDLLWADGRFRPDLAVEVDDAGGSIVRIGPASALAAGSSVERLVGRALLPGFVNAHSHAFQRLIRGRTQWRPAGAEGADFWSWRDAMYQAALTLDPDDVYAASRFCFLEMLRAGYTAVGEFHYLHRDPAGEPYADPQELAERVIAAAVDAGIRVALLDVCYAAGGIGEPLAEEQRRFATPELDAHLAGVEELGRRHAADPLVSVGVAPHSMRAVPRAWLRPLAEGAARLRVPLHMHVSEQRREVEASVAAHGLRPFELLQEEGVLSEAFTGVHATHLSDAEVRALAASAATVCACPTTERDLGDGFLPVQALRRAGVPIALGSDSHTVIAPLEEVRAVEYHERLRQEARIMVTTAAGDRLEVGPPLLDMATAAGARSLGLPAGALEPGRLADLVAVDLLHPALEGWNPDTLPALLALSAPPDVVADVWVGGVRRIRERSHPDEGEAAAAFRGVVRRRLESS